MNLILLILRSLNLKIFHRLTEVILYDNENNFFNKNKKNIKNENSIDLTFLNKQTNVSFST